MKVPLCEVYFDNSEIDALAEVLRSGWLTHGPKNKELEDLFTSYVGVDHAISMNSCTSALQLAIIANEIKGEVIIPSFTWVATANAVETSGATPVFADIIETTAMIDPESIEAAITPQTEAVILVHFGGSSANLDEISAICKTHNLLLIEDSAETIGGKYKDKFTGSFGLGCFSFFPTKNFTTGEGGMLTTNDSHLATKVRALIGHGINKSTYERELSRHPWIRAASYAGYNFRLSNILAALGVEQFQKLDMMNDLRRTHASFYNSELSGIEEIRFMHIPDYVYHVYQMYTIRVDNKLRTEFIMYLRERGVEASVHFDPPVHLQPFYRTKFPNVSLPSTEKLASEIVSLPIFPGITQEQLDYVVDNIKTFFRKK